MLKKNAFAWAGILFLLAVFSSNFRAVHAQGATVKGVLFYSPQCPHCQTVRETMLPTLQERYGSKFQLLEIDTSTEAVSLYFSAVESYQIPPERQGVPTLIVGETILVGSAEIPEQLPGLLEEGLAAGGIGWPEIPGLEDFLVETEQHHPQETSSAEVPSTGTAVPTALPTLPEATLPAAVSGERLPGKDPSRTADPVGDPDASGLDLVRSRFRRDLTGNLLSTGVLAGMLIVLLDGGVRLISPSQDRTPWPAWIIPALAAAGLVVASYLSFVEVTKTTAVCGPVGDCNAVQQSSYATLFGFLPVGIFGLVGYQMIIDVWLIRYFTRGRVRDLAGQGLWLLSFFGLLFSVYLTFLEPFVIGATCAWCLTSAVIMSLIFMAATSLLERSWALVDTASNSGEKDRIR